jgi:hypothetical protein
MMLELIFGIAGKKSVGPNEQQQQPSFFLRTQTVRKQERPPGVTGYCGKAKKLNNSSMIV